MKRIFTVRNEVAKVMFLHVCVCPQGGEYLGRYPPGTRYTPPGTRYTPRGTRYTPWDQVHPPTRYTPLVHSLGPGSPPRATVTPSPRRLLLRTVRILLECILVFLIFIIRKKRFYTQSRINDNDVHKNQISRYSIHTDIP